MKRTRIIGLAMVTALALTAFAGTASATGPVGLSIVNNGEGPEFHSELYPATISGAQVSGSNKVKIYTDVGTILCETYAFSSSAWAPSGIIADTTELVLAPSASGCTLAGIGLTTTPVTDCNYTFKLPGAPTYLSSLYVCQTQFKAAGINKCTVTVSGHTASGVEYVNAGSGTSATVEAKLNLAKTPYQVSGGKYCPNPVTDGSYNNGKVIGVVSLSAKA